MLNRILILMISFLVLVTLWPAASPVASRAQTQALDVIYLNTVADPQDDGIDLSIYFSLKDRNGDPVLKGSDQNQVDFESEGSILISDDRNQPVMTTQATVEAPSTPIKIVLLIDKSGSMNSNILDENGKPVLDSQQNPTKLIDAVRAAAVQAVDVAPQESEIAVFSFAERPDDQPLQGGFLRKSDQSGTIKSAIGQFVPNKAGQGNTCIYDALDKAIGYLNANVEESSVDRTAIILFTDGIDHESGPCGSNLTEDNIITIAKEKEDRPIPIYTVAPCAKANNSNDCGSIDQGALEDLSKETGAFSIIDDPRNITASFSRVMAILNSQWVVRTKILARNGTNTATFAPVIRNISFEAPVIARRFFSPKDYNPPPTVQVRVGAYAPDTNAYPTNITVANPDRVGELNVNLYDSPDGGKLVNSQEYSFSNPDTSIEFPLSANGLEVGRDYFIRINAKDKDNNVIPIPIIDENNEVVKSYKFTNDPIITIRILDARKSADDQTLSIDIKALGFGERDWRDLMDNVEIRDKETNDRETISPIKPITDTIRIMLPEMIQKATKPKEYIFNLIIKDDKKSITIESLEKTILPPRQLSFGEVLLITLRNPFVFIGVPALLIVVLAILLYPRLRSRRRTIPAPRPQNEATILLPPKPREKAPPEKTLSEKTPPADATVLHTPDPVAKPRVRLRVRVTQTPDPMQIHDRVFSAFPVVIGRSRGELIITGDPKISGAHVQISETKDGFTLTDLNSTNGTTVGEKKLEKGEKVTFSERTVVGLGPNTTIELDPKQ